jgi:hypothetical protein
LLNIENYSKKVIQEKATETTQQKKKRGKNFCPRKRKACHSVRTALLKSVAEMLRITQNASKGAPLN